jgi:murein L,D-transpeptidase YcbB/YkuD
MITYYTAWVDDNGKLNFRDDIYGHDKDLAQKMFYH